MSDLKTARHELPNNSAFLGRAIGCTALPNSVTAGVDRSGRYSEGYFYRGYVEMRLSRENGDRVLVIGYFPKSGDRAAAPKNLHRARVRRAAAVHALAKGRPRVQESGVSAIGGSATAWLSASVGAPSCSGSAGCWPTTVWLGRSPSLCFSVAGALAGWILVRLLQQHVDAASLDWCKRTILPAEMVVIARVRADDTPHVLAILRDVEAEAPVTFSFYSPPPLSAELTTRPLWPERPSGQRLAENAARLRVRSR